MKKIGAFIRQKPALFAACAAGFAVLCAAAVLLVFHPWTPADAFSSAGNRPGADGLPGAGAGNTAAVPLSYDTAAFDLLSVQAAKISGNMIETDTGFILKTDKDVLADKIKPLLALEPDMPFALEKDKDAPCTYLLHTDSPFPADSIVKLAFQSGENPPRGWAFQTKNIFRVVSALPAHLAEYVPVNTGIEITFSQNDVSAAEFERHFGIEPAVSGRFEKYRSTLVFIPDAELAQETVYTVTVKAGLTAGSGDSLSEDKVFRFETQKASNRLWCYLTGGVSETFLPGDRPLLELRCSDEFQDGVFKVKLYRYADEESQRDALVAYIQNELGRFFDTSELSLVYSADDTPVPSPDPNAWGGLCYLMLPEGLEQGNYLAHVETRMDGETFVLQKRIQISPISVYAGILPNAASFFVNDTRTGGALSGAELSLVMESGEATARTGADGGAVMPLQAAENGVGVLRVSGGGHVYLDMLDYRASQARDPFEDYYLYLYTDRSAYLSTDTIRVWGVVRPRVSGAVTPPDLTLTLGYDNTEGSPVPVSLKPDGTFTAQIELTGHMEYGLPVNLKSDGTLLCRTWVEITDYVKPTYTVDVTAPLFALRPQNDPVTVAVDAAFFDGAPAPGTRFRAYGNASKILPDSVAADQNGRAEVKVTADDYNEWRPRWVHVGFDMEGIENEYQHAYAGFYAFHRDVMLEHEFTASGKTGALAVKTSLMDTGRIQSAEDIYDDDLLRGGPAEVAVSAELYRYYYVKTETGRYYDFINKKDVIHYNYDRVDVRVDGYERQTANGEAVFGGLPLGEKESGYYMKLSYRDTKGAPVEETVYLWDMPYRYYMSGYHYYTFTPESRYFTENQPIRLALMDNDEPVFSGGRVFYAVSRAEFLKTGATEKLADITLPVESGFIPNVMIGGAYFDGRHVFPVYTNYYWFSPEERGLEIDVAADKEFYAPGDTAEVTVTATGADGQPAAGASVSVSVADEAAFAVLDQSVDTLGGLYRAIDTPWLNTYASYVQHVADNDGAEQGGGGNDSVRRDFKDTAAFLTGVTGADGKASFTFKLPDNLTKWRVTAQAVSADMRAGDTKAGLIVTRPFFLTPVALPQYIAGDDITVSARANGQFTGSVTVSARLTGDGIDSTVSGLSGQPLAFGKLAAGEYTLLFSAKSGDHGDAIEQGLTVVASALEAPVTRTFDLGEQSGLFGLKPGLKPARYPVTLGFYDSQYALYGKVLDKLYRSWGGRADQRVAQAYASMELGFSDADAFRGELADIAPYGAASLFPYAESDLTLTALLCAAVPEIMGNSQQAFTQALSKRESTAEEVSACYMGLAAFSRPVLSDILDLLQDPAGLTDEDQLRLCAGLALLGDGENARRYYDQLTQNAVKRQQAPKGGEWAYIDGPDKNTTVARTALALITASALRLPEADGMALYLTENESTEQTTVLELIVYLRHYSPPISGSAAFSYTLDGKTEEVKLDKFGRTVLRFGKEQLENANFKVLSGGVACVAYYRGALSEQERQSTMAIDRKVEPVSGGYQPGGLLKVTLTPQLKEKGVYTVEDVIPSGARYAGGGTRNVSSRSGQRLSATVYYNPKQPANGTQVVYYIRCVQPGEYVWEGAALTDRYGNWGQSERGSLTVTP